MTFKILNTFILILAKLLIGLNFSFANDIELQIHNIIMYVPKYKYLVNSSTNLELLNLIDFIFS